MPNILPHWLPPSLSQGNLLPQDPTLGDKGTYTRKQIPEKQTMVKGIQTHLVPREMKARGVDD